MPAIQLRDDQVDETIYVDRAKIVAVTRKDGRTLVIADRRRIFVSETLAEALALWLAPLRNAPPVIRLHDIDAKTIADMNKVIHASRQGDLA